jgi:hypothetical protein
MAALNLSTKINEAAYYAIGKPDKQVRYTIKKDLDRTFPTEAYFDL